MTDRLKFERLLRELYEARMHGPVDRLCKVFSPDIHFRIAGTSDGKPISINADGIEAVRPWLAMLVKTFRLSEHHIESMLVDQDRAAVHWSASIHSRITGAQVKTELVDLVQFRNLQIISYVEFFVPH